MTETPKCPYCGAETRLNENNEGIYWYECWECNATGPTEKTPVEAFSAALHRAEAEMRPLTLEEIWEAVDDEDWNFVWLEYNLSSYTLQIIPQHRSKTYFYFLIPGVDEGGRKEPIVEINKEWRCWPRNPTPEQMAAAEWEEPT
jgi:hypothetical protein|nr:MAG TPA: Dam-replacing family [Caudoviricetes sp.]